MSATLRGFADEEGAVCGCKRTVSLSGKEVSKTGNFSGTEAIKFVN